jgi:AcrR family transcriptional regulator
MQAPPPPGAGSDAPSTRAPKPDEIGEANAGARGRILSTAYDLFCRHGVQAIGIDRIVAEARVAKMTLYRHFRSKDDLAVAVLDLREELWLHGWLITESGRRAETPHGRLLVIFEMFDDWFRRADYEGCLFNNTLLEDHDPASPVRLASIVKRSRVLAFLRSLAEEAGARDPDTLARQWQMLMSGAMIAGSEGDLDAARRARDVGSLLLGRELQPE